MDPDRTLPPADLGGGLGDLEPTDGGGLDPCDRSSSCGTAATSSWLLISDSSSSFFASPSSTVDGEASSTIVPLVSVSSFLLASSPAAVAGAASSTTAGSASLLATGPVLPILPDLMLAASSEAFLLWLLSVGGLESSSTGLLLRLSGVLDGERLRSSSMGLLLRLSGV